MTNSEMKRLLKETGYTRDEMDYMWYYLKTKGHKVIIALSRSGVDWRGMNVMAAGGIHLQYIKYGGELESLKEKARRYKVLHTAKRNIDGKA